MRNVPGHEIWADPEDRFWLVGQKITIDSANWATEFDEMPHM